MLPLTLTRELRTFVEGNFLFGQASGEFAFDDEDSFIEQGIVDSTGILEVVAHVEQKYGIAIDDEELVPENLDSIVRLAAFVERKLAGAGASIAR